MEPHFDPVDTQILQLLQHDARISNKELADKLGKSTTAIHERRKKLEDSGVIQQYVAILNKELIGRNLLAFTTIQLKEHSQDALKGFMREGKKFEEVMECYHLTGTFDFLLKITIRDMVEYNSFLINKLSTLPNIGVVQSFFVLSEGKVGTAYPLMGEKGARRGVRR